MGANLKDVAARAGVSVRTVSNVVTGSASVAPQTRARVQQVLDELQYRPNLAARNLRRGRTGLIGLVIPELDSPYFGELAGLLVDAAQSRSWTVLIDQSGGDADGERRLLEGTGARVLDGLIMSPWALSPDDLAHRTASLPLVLLGEQDSQGLADHVTVDNVAAASRGDRPPSRHRPSSHRGDRRPAAAAQRHRAAAARGLSPGPRRGRTAPRPGARGGGRGAAPRRGGPRDGRAAGRTDRSRRGVLLQRPARARRPAAGPPARPAACPATSPSPGSTTSRTAATPRPR